MDIQLVAVYLAILLVLISWGFTYFKHNKQASINYWPVLGNLPSRIWNSNRLLEWITEVFISSGKGSFCIEGFIFSKIKTIVTCHPQNIEYILKTNFANFPKGSRFIERFDFVGDSIFNVDNEPWRLQRKMAHAHLSSATFRSHVDTSTQKVVEDQLVPILAFMAETGRVFDLQDVCKRFAFDSNIRNILGGDEKYLSRDLPVNEFAIASANSQEAILYRHVLPTFLWKCMRWLRVGKERKLAEAKVVCDVFLQKYISKRREDMDKGLEMSDILSGYIKSGNELCLDDKFLRDTMLSLFVAGLDTIASGLVWFLWLIIKNPCVEAKMVDELKLICMKKNKYGKRPMVFDFDDLKGSVYLHAAICESLRLYPPVPFNSKCVIKDDVLPDGTRVMPGMQILISFYSEGNMPWIWGNDSTEFKPERWIDENGKLKREPLSKFFAFNVGARSCLGKDISFTQMKVAIAAILFNFHIELLEDYSVNPKQYISLNMKDGLLVKLKERPM